LVAGDALTPGNADADRVIEDVKETTSRDTDSNVTEPKGNVTEDYDENKSVRGRGRRSKQRVEEFDQKLED
jgi:hypothetical protein